MIKKWIGAMLLCAVVWLLPGCGPAPGEDLPGDAEHPDETPAPLEDDTVRVAYYPNETVNPVLSRSRINTTFLPLCYEGLFELTPDLSCQPALCESYTVSGTEFIFTIKSGVTFWSGQPLTAEDVRYTLELAWKDETSIYKERLQEVSSIEALDDRRVRVTLQRENAEFYKRLNIPVFRAGTETEEFSEGTGPYRPEKREDGYVLTPFSGWHKGTAGVFPEIVLTDIMSYDLVPYSFETGGLSIALTERIGVTSASVTGALEIYPVKTTDLHYLGVNTAKEPLQNSAVRRAISLSIDRQSICAAQLQGFADPVVFPEAEPQESTVQNAGQAIQVLRSGGFEDRNGDGVVEYETAGGRRQDLELAAIVNGDNTFKVQALQQIQENFSEIGIRLTIESLSFEEFQEAIETGTYDLYYGETFLTADFDLGPLVEQGGALNYSGYTGLEAYIAEYRTDPAAKDAYRTAFLEEMPMIPLALERWQVIARQGLAKGICPAPDNIFYDIENWSRE